MKDYIKNLIHRLKLDWSTSYRYEIAQQQRAQRQRERLAREHELATAPCPFCNAEIKSFVVTQRTYKGKLAGAIREWSCGTKTSLGLMMSQGIERGDECIKRTKNVQ